MTLDPARKPHGFVCPGCGGCCDVIPPNSHWEWHKCGTMNKGVRCLKPIPRGSVVCLDCEHAVSRSLAEGHSGREFLVRLLGGYKQVRMDIDAQSTLERAAKRHAAEMAKREQLEAKRLLRESEAGYVVYYIRLGQNHIKIGTTNRLPDRMRELRVVNATNLLAAEPGGYPTETARHTQFKKWRYNRRKEDFGECDELLEHIENVRAMHGEPYALAAQLARSTAQLP